jgi:rhodanese-related sulfurtransferase
VRDTDDDNQATSQPLPVEMGSGEVQTWLIAGCLYLDLRTPLEFDLGHVPGAYNLPMQLGDIAGLRANPAFEPVVLAVFSRDQPLILGCHSGARSRSAQRRLIALGFERLSVHREGWDGQRDAFGRKSEGWGTTMPVERVAQPGRDYETLRAHASSENCQARHRSAAR